MIEIRYYAEEFEKAHIEFAKKYWTKKRRLTPEYIYWKFRRKTDEKLTSFLLAFDDEKVVGQFGLIPCKLRLGELVLEAQWACDLMVDIDYRGKGIADKLYKFAHANKLITLGSDPSPAAKKSMIKNGYTSIDGPVKFIFPFYIGEIFKLKKINNRFLNNVPNPFLILIYLFKNINYTSIAIKEYALLEHKKKINHIYCHHDTSFLDWRFSKFSNYYSGIICFKKDKKNFFTGYIRDSIFYVTDFNVKNLLEFLKLIGFVYEEFNSLKLNRIKFVSNNFKINYFLPFLGFIKFRTITNVILFTESLYVKKYIGGKFFYYTLHDSDENI